MDVNGLNNTDQNTVKQLVLTCSMWIERLHETGTVVTPAPSVS